MLVNLWIPWGKCRASGDDRRKSADNPGDSKIPLDQRFRVPHQGYSLAWSGDGSEVRFEAWDQRAGHETFRLVVATGQVAKVAPEAVPEAYRGQVADARKVKTVAPLAASQLLSAPQPPVTQNRPSREMAAENM